MHAPYGSLVPSGPDKVICHVCGGPYKNLGIHVAHGHGMSADEYRRVFGLSVGLVADATRALLSDLHGEKMAAIAKSAEQRALVSQRHSLGSTAVVCRFCGVAYLASNAPSRAVASCGAESCKRQASSHAHTGQVRTHCREGHPLTGENVLMEAGDRRCRLCRKARRAR